MTVKVSAAECSARAFNGLQNFLSRIKIQFERSSILARHAWIAFEEVQFRCALDDGTTVPYRECEIWATNVGDKTRTEILALLRSKGVLIWPNPLPNKKKAARIQRLADTFASLDDKSKQEFLNLTGLSRTAA